MTKSDRCARAFLAIGGRWSQLTGGHYSELDLVLKFPRPDL